MPGFTKIDNPLLERLLTSSLTKRQLKVILLVIRFSSGYQKTYARLRRSDFAFAGISASNVGEELRKLTGLRILRSDPRKDIYWLNPNLDQWAVENPVDSRGMFFRISARNSLRWQLSVSRNSSPKVPKTGSDKKEEERKTKKLLSARFLRVLTDYFLRVSPLDARESQVLHEIAQAFDLRTIGEAIRVVSEGDRTFSQFLKTLDTLASTVRQGQGFTPIRSGISRRLKTLHGS